MPSELLSTKQVAERRGVAVRTVAAWVERGRLAPVLRLPGIRGAMFFDPADVDSLDGSIEGAA